MLLHIGVHCNFAWLYDYGLEGAYLLRGFGAGRAGSIFTAHLIAAYALF
jgi:hypothetical protein